MLQGLNEFVDVTGTEKIFLNAWKRFIRTDSVVAYDKVPGKCLEFIRLHQKLLKGLRTELLMHLMTLWENKLIPSDHILICMNEHDALQENLHDKESEVPANSSSSSTSL